MARDLLSCLAISLVLLAGTACGDEPAASTRDATTRLDSGDRPPDSGAPADDAAEPEDTGAHPDAEVDAGVPEDSGAPDSGEAPDSGVPEDSGVAPDSGAPADAGVSPADAGPELDAGVVLVDGDADGIADSDEGNGLIDTDRDNLPDSMDPDSDNDGIPDSTEGGDGNLSTRPPDSDNDGTPDFRDSDSDNDTIPDLEEGSADPDGDGLGNHVDVDADGDTIRDDHEGTLDQDQDTTPSYLDPDSDGDGVDDGVEAGDADLVTRPVDSDNDGTPDAVDTDSDNDTILDAHEGGGDADSDLLPNRIDVDSDNDSILDLVEAGDASPLTQPFNGDGDSTPDFLDLDSDDDTISDLDERQLDSDGDTIPNYLDPDSDNDGFPDSVEAGDADLATPPARSDLDPQPDYLDQDSDGDGLADAVELGCPVSTNRTAEDSDFDGFVDPAEIAYGSGACNAGSGIDGFYFVLPPGGPGANAPLVFSDTAIDRADFAINMDNTGSMGGEIANLRTTLSNTIIPGVRAVIPDSAFAVSSFDDFPIDPFGTTGDLPFRLGSRVTLDAAAAQAAVNALAVHNGVDFPESGLESVWQVLTGSGVTWPGGAVAAFNPASGLVPGVADGTIGGVGFRSDALPVIVQITDALSHTRRDYQAVNAGINAASVADVRNALVSTGARVIGVSSGSLRLPFNDLLCSGGISTFFGAIDANDVDWYELQGVTAGDTVTADILAAGFLSELDTMVAIASSTAIIAQNDDVATGDTDSLVTATLSGTGPWYVAVAAYGDTNFAGTGGQSSGFYLANVDVNGTAYYPSPTACRVEDAGSRTGATPLVIGSAAAPPGSFAQCVTDCDTILGGESPFFQDFAFPYELAEETSSVIPPCAWSEFGATRPAGCAADQCCTGLNGAGYPPNAQGLCPLSFEIDDTGAGLDAAVVTGIQALVSFSTFTVTTVVRPDPVELAATGFDTTCFIHGVTPLSASASACAPAATPADLVPPSPALDSFLDVVPGALLTFQVDALNQSLATSMPCAPSLTTPQLFRAYIDVIADGVTVVDTRDVIIIVPPSVSGGGS